MATTAYYPGGYLPDAPAQNRSEEWDEIGETYTAWDPNGKVLEQRPLTADELENLTPATPEPSETDRLRTRVAELEDVLVAKGIIAKADAEAVATAEVTATEITKPGETKDAAKVDPGEPKPAQLAEAAIP